MILVLSGAYESSSSKTGCKHVFDDVKKFIADFGGFEKFQDAAHAQITNYFCSLDPNTQQLLWKRSMHEDGPGNFAVFAKNHIDVEGVRMVVGANEFQTTDYANKSDLSENSIGPEMVADCFQDFHKLLSPGWGCLKFLLYPGINPNQSINFHVDGEGFKNPPSVRGGNFSVQCCNLSLSLFFLLPAFDVHPLIHALFAWLYTALVMEFPNGLLQLRNDALLNALQGDTAEYVRRVLQKNVPTLLWT